MRSLIVVPALAAVAVAGCGGSSKTSSSPSTPAAPATSTAPASGAGSTVLTEAEYRFTPNTVSVAKSGSVTITVQNRGTIVHSFEIASVNGKPVRAADIQPGSSGSVTVTLKPGSYSFFCPIDGHRALGMTGTITVAGGGAPSSNGAATAPAGGASTSGGGGTAAPAY